MCITLRGRRWSVPNYTGLVPQCQNSSDNQAARSNWAAAIGVAERRGQSLEIDRAVKRRKRSKRLGARGALYPFAQTERDAHCSLAGNLFVEILDHFAELLIADLTVTVLVDHSDEFVHLAAM